MLYGIPRRVDPARCPRTSRLEWLRPAALTLGTAPITSPVTQRDMWCVRKGSTCMSQCTGHETLGWTVPRYARFDMLNRIPRMASPARGPLVDRLPRHLPAALSTGITQRIQPCRHRVWFVQTKDSPCISQSNGLMARFASYD